MRPTSYLTDDWDKKPLLSMRDAFGKGLLEAGQRHPNIVTVCADLDGSIKFDYFANEFPQRHVQVGVAEQNMISVAAGLALSGKNVFAGSYAVFSPGRTWDQIRVNVAYSKTNVKVVGSHTGLNVGPDGATHQALEDIAITRVLPNMTILAPSDADEAYHCALVCGTYQGPVYIRLAREGGLQITQASDFEIGRIVPLTEGHHVTVACTGLMVQEAVMAAYALWDEGISVEVLAFSSLKPFDKLAFMRSIKKTRCLITVEEHQKAGGLGSILAEFTSQYFPIPIVMMGMNDAFGESGTSDQLLDKYGLKAHNIIRVVKRVISRKRG